MNATETQEETNLDKVLLYEARRSPTLRATKSVIHDIYNEHLRDAETVLEVGSGLGHFRRDLVSQFEGTWIQMELDIPTVQLARKLDERDNYVVGSALVLPFKDNSIDAVCGFNCYDLMLGYGNAPFAEAKRVLKKGGTFLHIQDLQTPVTIKGPNGEEEDLEASPMDRSRIVAKMLQERLTQHFDPETINTIVRYGVIEGKRTDEQEKKKGSFVFSNTLGTFQASREFRIHIRESETILKIPTAKRLAYNALSYIVPPLAKAIVPEIYEVAVVSFTKATKT